MMQNNMSILNPIPFTKIVDALLDENTPFSPRYLHRLSDLDPADTALLAATWPKISLRRREALLEDMDENHLADDLLWYEEVGRVALKDSAPSVRQLAVHILREYELVDLLPTFVQMAEQDLDADVRAASAAALATFIYMGEVEDISPKKLLSVEECLLRLISSEDTPLVRRRALESLGFSSREEVVGLIQKAYASPEIDWLVTALFTIGRSANPRWNPQVLKMLAHQRPIVRAEAASAAGELEIKKALLILLELLEDVDADVRIASIWALSQVGGEGVRSALENMLENTDDDVEADQITNALENLDFTKETRNLDILDIPEDGKGPDDSSEDDFNEDLDEPMSEDNED
jgi:HEAT repeat protein